MAKQVQLPGAIKKDLEVLRLFNRKVDKLEQSGFWKRYQDEVPNAIVKMEEPRFEKVDDKGRFSIVARVHSWLEDFNQDEIDAFVLTYRIFTQNNDQLSLASLGAIYARPWMPEQARSCFDDARKQLNDHLGSYATLDFGDGPIQLRTLVDTVIYGGLAHSHERKSKIFESWETSGIMGFVWAEFFAYAREAADTMLYLRGLNASLLEHVDKYGFTTEPPEPKT